MTALKLLINGKLVQGAGTLDVINPATGRILTVAPRADRAQLEEAVAAAKAAFATPLRERGARLVGLAAALEAEHGAFARLLTEEQGKPLPQAHDEITRSIATPATSPRSTCHPKCSRRMPRGRWFASTSRSAWWRPSRRGICRCSC